MAKFKILKKKILIFGASGLLGSNWLAIKSKDFNNYSVFNRRIIKSKKIPSFKLNLSNQKDIEKLVKKIRPKLILNFIALTNVDECEKNKRKALFVNFKITSNIVKICNKLQIKLIHISSDHIFSTKHKFKSEKFKTNSINYYAETKILADNEIIKNLKNYLIIRTNFFGYGTSYRSSFSDYIINNIISKQKIIISDNIYFNPVYIRNLINIIHKLIDKDATGIFNIASNNRISKYKFATLLCNLYGLNKDYILKKEKTNNEYIFKRPKEMSLNNKKVSKLLNINIGSIKENILMMKKDKFLSRFLLKY